MGQVFSLFPAGIRPSTAVPDIQSLPAFSGALRSPNPLGSLREMLDVFRHAIQFEFWYGHETLDEWIVNLGLPIDAVRRLALAAPGDDQIKVLSFVFHKLGDAVVLLRRGEGSVRQLLDQARDSVDLAYHAASSLADDSGDFKQKPSTDELNLGLAERFAALRRAVYAPGSELADHRRCVASRSLHLFLVYCLCVAPAVVTQQHLDEFKFLHGELKGVMCEGTAYFYSCQRRGRYAFPSFSSIAA